MAAAVAAASIKSLIPDMTTGNKLEKRLERNSRTAVEIKIASTEKRLQSLSRRLEFWFEKNFTSAVISLSGKTPPLE